MIPTKASLQNLRDFDWSSFLSIQAFIASILLIIAILAVRVILLRLVRGKNEVLNREQRQWSTRIKNGAAIGVLIGLIMIWAPQLQTFAISIAAFAVALVIATKEMILCLTGALLRATTRPFKVGDWITVDTTSGEVIDTDPFSTTVQEVDMASQSYDFTGRTITIPNSKFFTSQIENANFFKLYVFKDIKISVQYDGIEVAPLMVKLKSITEERFKEVRDDAVEFNRRIRRRKAVEIGRAEPSYDITTSDLGHYHFHVRLFVPTHQAGDISRDITEKFLGEAEAMRKKSKASEEA